MNKSLRGFVREDLEYALERVGYRNINPHVLVFSKYGKESEWRRQQFHVFIKGKREDRLVLHLHLDVSVPMPPFHRAIQAGPQVGAELSKVMAAYMTRRRMNAGITRRRMEARARARARCSA